MNTNDLSHEIWAVAQLAPKEGIEYGVARVAALLDAARAIESKVRKADTELIRQMLEALEPFAYETPAREAIAAGRARLEDKP